MKKMLLVYAHPDDESFTAGGTVCKYVKAGWQVDLLCATKGEAGQHGPYDESENLADLRQKELAEAAAVLGISSVRYLDLIDGTLASLHPGDLEEKVFTSLLEYDPDVVITFEPNGITHHPDHNKLCLSTTFAFQKYAKLVLKGEKLGSRDPRRYLLRSEGPINRVEPKLFYACMPQSVANYLREKKVIPEESFGKPWVGVADKIVTTVIDISKYKAKKIEALQKHRTQVSDVDKFLSLASNPLLRQEYYILRMVGEHEVFMGNNDVVSNRL